MGIRVPLEPGSIVTMPNKGEYIICEKIGEGGLSLVYSAMSAGNYYPVIVKEFYPTEHAGRAEKDIIAADGTVEVKAGQVCSDGWDPERFELRRQAFEQEGRLGSSARISNFQVISFSDCGGGYAVLPRWSNDSRSFSDLVKEWRKNPPKSIDPFFMDLGRVRFALTAISSLLVALSAVHGQNMLHLDITPGNVVWANQSTESPENGVAFLTDFGCSVMMEKGGYPAEEVLSYSIEYSAPEYTVENARLSPATDIYSVGKLLGFLCFGKRAFDAHFTQERIVDRLHVSERCRKALAAIIRRATHEDMGERYQTADEMQDAVTALLDSIPLDPINADNSSAFSLYSLRSMLEGSVNPRYSWAHELCDRRGVKLEIHESAHHAVANLPEGGFGDEISFLRAVLPEEILSYLSEQLEKEGDKTFCLKKIMSGTYPKEWKDEVCRRLRSYGTRRLLQISRTLLKNKNAFQADMRILFKLLKGEEKRFSECCYGCDTQRAPYIGLALLCVFALLGADGFAKFMHSSSEAGELFRPL